MCMPFTYFSSLIAISRTFIIILNTMVRVGIFVLLQVLGEGISNFIIKYKVMSRVSKDALYHTDEVSIHS